MQIRVKVYLVGSLRKYLDNEPFKYIKIDKGDSVLAVLSNLKINVRRVMVIVNGERSTMKYIPGDLDIIKIIPVVTGG